ncbi:hypothetical protein Tco_1037867 [Tanacetum coccineum]
MQKNSLKNAGFKKNKRAENGTIWKNKFISALSSPHSILGALICKTRVQDALCSSCTRKMPFRAQPSIVEARIHWVPRSFLVNDVLALVYYLFKELCTSRCAASNILTAWSAYAFRVMQESFKYQRPISMVPLQCTKPKRPQNSAWFKEKMLSEALESRAYLNPGQLVFLADTGDTIIPAQASQEIPTPAAFQTDDLDAFDSDCDDVPSAKAVLMANLSSYDLDIF